MIYNCYVFDNESHLIQGIDRYEQLGGKLNEIKVLIKDVAHGHLLSSSGVHHVDYLNEITDANHIIERAQHQSDSPLYFVGITTGQATPGVVSGIIADEQTNAMEALTAYGLSSERATDALKALRDGHFLVFTPNDNERWQHSNSNGLYEALSATFGESTRGMTENVASVSFSGAAYTIKKN